MESSSSVSSFAREFDYLYKKTYDRIKIIEIMISQLIEKIESEDKLTKSFEKLSQSIPRNGGEFDDLLSALKIDLSQRASQNKIFKQSFSDDINAISAKLKTTNQQLKPLMLEAEKSDKDIRTLYEKMDRARERNLKLNKEFEELILTIQASEWNSDLNTDSKEKLLGKLGFLNTQKVESEQVLEQLNIQYNLSVQTTQNSFNVQSKLLRSMYCELFDEFKNLIMKQLVLEISRLRNIQYDTEQFFKEVEKYEQQAEFYVLPDQYKFNYNFASVKQDFQVQQLKEYQSFVTNLTKQTIYSNKQLINFKSEKQSLPKTALFLDDENFNKQYAELCQNLILKAHNKLPNNDSKILESNEISSIESKEKNDETIDDSDRKPDEAILLDPLAKPKLKQSSQPKKLQIFFDQFQCNFNSLDNNRLQNYIETAKFIVNQSTTDSNKIETTKTLEQLFQQFEEPETKEICLFVLDQFNNAQVNQISNLGLKNIGHICDQLVKNIGYDIKQIRRLFMIFQNLYKIFDSQKIYLREIVKFPIDIQRNDLWLGILFLNIYDENNKNLVEQPKFLDKEQQKLKEKQLFIQQIYNLATLMFTMKVEKTLIRNVCYKSAIVLGLQEIQIQDIYNFIERDCRQELNNKIVQPVSSSIVNFKSETTQQQAKVIIFDKKTVNQPLIQSTQQTQNQQPLDPLTSSIVKSGKLPIPNPLTNIQQKKETEEKKQEVLQTPIKEQIQTPIKEIKPLQPLGLFKKQQESRQLENLFGYQRYEDPSKQKEEQKDSKDSTKKNEEIQEQQQKVEEQQKKVEEYTKKSDLQIKRSGDPLGVLKPRSEDPLGVKQVNKNNPLDRKR